MEKIFLTEQEVFMTVHSRLYVGVFFVLLAAILMAAPFLLPQLSDSKEVQGGLGLLAGVIAMAGIDLIVGRRSHAAQQNAPSEVSSLSSSEVSSSSSLREKRG